MPPAIFPLRLFLPLYKLFYRKKFLNTPKEMVSKYHSRNNAKILQLVNLRSSIIFIL